MRPVGTGEFLVDKTEMHRKLAINRRKIWRHRLSVIWREFHGYILGLTLSVGHLGLVFILAPRDPAWATDPFITYAFWCLVGFPALYAAVSAIAVLAWREAIRPLGLDLHRRVAAIRSEW